MKLKTILFSMVVFTVLFLSAFGSPAMPQTVRLQDTVVPPDATLVVPPTVVVQSTQAVPVTGGDAPTGLWTIVLFGLLALLGIAFLVALFSPRTVQHEHIDRNPPPPPDV